MQTSETIQCPFCGQNFELLLETNQASQQFTTDCEVCCRPLQVRVEYEGDETLSLEVEPG